MKPTPKGNELTLKILPKFKMKQINYLQNKCAVICKEARKIQKINEILCSEPLSEKAQRQAESSRSKAYAKIEDECKEMSTNTNTVTPIMQCDPRGAAVKLQFNSDKDFYDDWPGGVGICVPT